MMQEERRYRRDVIKHHLTFQFSYLLYNTMTSLKATIETYLKQIFDFSFQPLCLAACFFGAGYAVLYCVGIYRASADQAELPPPVTALATAWTLLNPRWRFILRYTPNVFLCLACWVILVVSIVTAKHWWYILIAIAIDLAAILGLNSCFTYRNYERERKLCSSPRPSPPSSPEELRHRRMHRFVSS